MMVPLTRLAALSLLLLTLFAPARSTVLAQASAPLLVIVGNATNLKDIPLALLRRAFQGEPAEYTSGKRLVPFNQNSGVPERVRFDRAILGLEPEDVGRFWINRRIRDEGAPPRTLASIELAIKVVASLPGAITYVKQQALPSNVRVLTIDGKSAHQPGYTLAR